jgi:hypothetical protein
VIGGGEANWVGAAGAIRSCVHSLSVQEGPDATTSKQQTKRHCS